MEKTSIVLGVVALLLSSLLLGVYTGFINASAFCEIRYPSISGSWVSDLNPYDADFENQQLVTAFLTVFLVGKLFNRRVISALICLPALTLAVYFNVRIIYYKSVFWNSADRYLRQERDLLNYDGTLLLILLVLILFEVFLLIRKRIAKSD